ncbi:MAG: ribbon-helix-helix domain-containing protein [Lapillicoccus sp.]
MRTTVTINDDLLRELKALAAREDRTIGSVLEDAIRQLLDQPRPAAQKRIPLPIYEPRVPGLRPGVDLFDREGLAEILGDNDSPF